jgi:hypothetical protein
VHIVEHLLTTSQNDHQLLEQLEKQGDNPMLLHTMEYCLGAPTKKKADTVCSFINDNAYGAARVESHGDSHRILVEIQTPLISNVVYCISANMVSLSHIFDIEFIGWGTTAETGDP